MTGRTATGATAANRGARGRRRALLAAAALTALLGGLTTHALWSASDGADGGTLVAGDLDIELSGPMTWTETSADVAGAPHPIDPDTFLAMPGDTLTASQGFVTTLGGDNIAGELTVRLADGGAPLPAGASAQYAVLDSAGELVPGTRGTPVGTPVVTALPAGSGSWTIVVDVALDSGAAPGYGGATSLVGGHLRIELNQVRGAAAGAS